MLARSSISTACTLLLLALASGCPKPDPAGDTETDTGTSSTGETTGATTPEATTTESMTDAATEGTTDGAMWPDCSEPDPAAQASVSIDFGEWPVVSIGSGAPDTISLAAECSVQSATFEAGVLDLALLCTEGEVVDVAIGVHLTAPADFRVDLAGVTNVRLDAYWQSDGHHISAGEWFVVHDLEDGELLLAGLDHGSPTAPSDKLGPFSLAEGAEVCPLECVDCEFDGKQRRALLFTHENGPSAQIVDRGREVLIVDARDYDIVVAEAIYNQCLNCSSDYVWILGGVFGEL